MKITVHGFIRGDERFTIEADTVAEVMAALAEIKGPQVPQTERIGWLQRAPAAPKGVIG